MANYDRKDHFYRKAKAAGLASRAAFKLDEMQKKYRLVRPGDRVIDLGCAPGGWLQPMSKWVGKGGRIVGLDLVKIRLLGLPSHVVTIKADINEIAVEDIQEALGAPEANLVVSDMAPHTAGSRMIDQIRSMQLVEMAWDVASQVLAPGGHFVAKFFEGPDVPAFRAMLREHFESVASFVPKAIRKGSIEKYFVAMGRRNK